MNVLHAIFQALLTEMGINYVKMLVTVGAFGIGGIMGLDPIEAPMTPAAPGDPITPTLGASCLNPCGEGILSVGSAFGHPPEALEGGFHMF